MFALKNWQYFAGDPPRKFIKKKMNIKTEPRSYNNITSCRSNCIVDLERADSNEKSNGEIFSPMKSQLSLKSC